jgi:hypothetical protein
MMDGYRLKGQGDGYLKRCWFSNIGDDALELEELRSNVFVYDCLWECVTAFSDRGGGAGAAADLVAGGRRPAVLDQAPEGPHRQLGRVPGLLGLRCRRGLPGAGDQREAELRDLEGRGGEPPHCRRPQQLVPDRPHVQLRALVDGLAGAGLTWGSGSTSYT